MTVKFKVLVLTVAFLASSVASAESTRISVTIDRGDDLGQSFGSLFEATSQDGSLIIGAGFQNGYNTRYRADRHDIQFFIRPADGMREITVEELPRPTKTLTGSYLFSRDGVVYSTYGGLQSWDPKTKSWRASKEVGGTHETMRVGSGQLEFGSSTVSYNGRPILDAPEKGSYQLFFYANGYLCFYHVHRNGKPYHFFENEEDGFSRLYACPWTPTQLRVDLSKATTLRLPVVGETTFAWGQLGKQIVTGSNIGGFYVFENDKWRMILDPKLGTSYQLYSTLSFHDHLLMGQYPTGRVFEYDGEKITDQAGWPPVPEGVSDRAREAQTALLYGGDLMVGVWPWGELWRFSPDSRKWNLTRRMFDHPEISDQIIHPYDVENSGNPVGNLWGQRVTSLVANGPDLFVSTSAKSPFEWDAKAFPFLAPDKWKSYGSVYRLTMPGHLTASTKWTDGTTKLEFTIQAGQMAIHQDGRQIAVTSVAGSLGKNLKQFKTVKNVKWGEGIYGRFGGASLDGRVSPQN